MTAPMTQTAPADSTQFAFEEIGLPAAPTVPRFVWAHGWGQDRRALAPLAEALSGQGTHLLLDFPGFGESAPPPEAWDTGDYADAAAELIASRPPAAKTVWIGHSFGCRVGLQIAARHPEAVDGLFLVAGAGLPRQRSLSERVRLGMRVRTFKALKRAAPVLGLDVETLRRRFGSRDYANAGEMRAVLAKVVSEDLSDVARTVQCPVHLVYGENDTETPPDIGERLSRLIPNADLTLLPRHDHYSVLAGGKHQVLKRLRDFVETVG
ncbi:MAG: alpha/beta fold hydrolase [Dichotomicrobium sp.]